MLFRSRRVRAGTGSVGAISTITAGVIVLTNPADVNQFSINQTLQANSSDGGSPRAAVSVLAAGYRFVDIKFVGFLFLILRFMAPSGGVFAVGV